MVEGSVRKAGNRVRVTVQLLDAAEDKHLWAQSYDRELKDVFAVQSDIASNVAETLRVKLLPNESDRIQKKPTENNDAHILYLKGRQQWNKRSEDAVRKAVEYFDLAIHHDQNYALAFVGLADCYDMLSDYNYMSPAEAILRIRPAVLKALQMDEGLAEAHASYGWILAAYDWNWDAAEAQYKRAIELNSSYASAHQWYSMLLRWEGRLEESLAESKKALELDPLAPIMSYQVGVSFYYLERYDDAIEYYNRSLTFEPNFAPALQWLSYAHAMNGDFDEALAWHEKLAGPGYPKAWAMIELAEIQARVDKKDEALSTLDSTMGLQDSRKISPTDVAWIFAALHDEDKAFEWLERAVMQHDNAIIYTISNPWFKELQARPRFQEILKEMGLDKYYY